VEGAVSPQGFTIEQKSPAWCFALGQAGAVGFIAALAVRGNCLAIAQALLGATVFAYTYVFAGREHLDPSRPLQVSQLIYRGVELGFVAVAGLIFGILARRLLSQRILRAPAGGRNRIIQYSLRDLMVVLFECGLALTIVNTFFNHFDRESQLIEIAAIVARSLPAAIPWLWAITQPRMSAATFAAVGGASLLLLGLKAAIDCAAMSGDLADVVALAGERATAFALAGAVNGVALRGLGFRWQSAG
jgi:hypothetical protein